MLEWATNPKFRPDRIRYTKMKTMGKKAVRLNIPAGVMHKDFTEPADGCQRMVFFFRSMYDAVKELLRSPRFRGRQYTEFEKVYTAGNKRQYGAINRGTMYEIAQGYAGPDVSPIPVFLSSDTTVICKKMGAHPLICEYHTKHCQCMYVYVCIYIYMYLYVCICMYIYVYVFIYMYMSVYVCICMYMIVSL